MAAAPKKKVSKKKASRKKKAKLASDSLASEVEPVIEEVQEGGIMSKQTVFELPPYFGIAQVAATKESMQSFLQSSGGEIEIQAEDVDSIDTAALQLLISFIKEAKSKGKNIKWGSTSGKLESSVELLAIKEELGIA